MLRANAAEAAIEMQRRDFVHFRMRSAWSVAAINWFILFHQKAV